MIESGEADQYHIVDDEEPPVLKLKIGSYQVWPADIIIDYYALIDKAYDSEGNDLIDEVEWNVVDNAIIMSR